MADDPDYLFALQLQQQLNGDQADSDTSSAKIVPESGHKNDVDYELALKLQAEFNAEDADISVNDSISNEALNAHALDMSNRNRNNNKNNINKMPPPLHEEKHEAQIKETQSSPDGPDNFLNLTQNLVHPQWEIVDPTPDIFAMFVRFDERFFQCRLDTVVVEWSKRMYTCAGICYQRGNRFFKDIIIRLSEPLLKLRPRKDLVETLLHEMIHAYCFVMNIREGNGGHGPNFKRIMGIINKVAGTNITVYHNFHDEVNVYKTHIWRCNGICQYHHPFQGWVKRTSNRAPGPNDQWWAKHQRECGGTFEKVSGPPPKKDSNPVPQPKTSKYTTKIKNETVEIDIRNYFGKPCTSINLLPQVQPALGLPGAMPPTSYPGLSSQPFVGLQPTGGQKKRTNIVGINDIIDITNENYPKSNINTNNEMQGQGYCLNDKTGNASSSPAQKSEYANLNHLRDVWSKRFPVDSQKTEPKSSSTEQNPRKRPREDELVCWEAYDNDVMVCNVISPVINISSSDDDSDVEVPSKTESDSESNPRAVKAAKVVTSHERTINIKREILEEELLFSDDDIIMIDDEYDDKVDADDDMSAAAELADQSLIDDLFGDDTLLEEFQRENDVVPCSSRYQYDTNNDITTCPICFEKMKRSEFANHLEGCSITIKVPAPTVKKLSQMPGDSNSINKPKSRPRRKPSRSKQQILKSSGYTSADIAALDLSSSSDSGKTNEGDITPRQLRQRTLYKQTTECPKCGQELLGHQMEAHRNLCKRKKRSK